MIKKKFTRIARDVINLEIRALENLKKSFNSSFNEAVIQISECQSKVVLCGVGKSGLIASKIAATLASVGTPSFNISASEASHGDLGMLSKKDLLIVISNSGATKELNNIIQFANRNKILLIGVVSIKNSPLHKAADIKILIPEVNEAEGIVPTASTTAQLALGDALAIASMKYKKFSKFDFKKLHPGGSLGIKLKTVEDLMLSGKNIPFVNEKLNMKKALSFLSKKKLGILIVRNSQKKTTGVITDGQIRRISQKKGNINDLKVRDIMTKSPISINKDALAAKALATMNFRKITSLCVHNSKNKNKTIGIIHIHHILRSNIS
jgi:arabinose-5-phosphate isomerase|tara:strand:- start:1505 stop:2473 length:969 start_codon:yes stop_codon:yes gene_type:complete